MITFSPGVAQGCFELLRVVFRLQLTIPQAVASFSHFSGIKSNDILLFAQDVGWLHSSEDGTLSVSPTGSRLLSLCHYELMLRQALLDLIDVFNPPWVQCAAFGRSRVLAFAGGGVAQTIVEAGLASGFEEEVIEFWDSLAGRARGLRDASLSNIGRKGERLTMIHEEARTGKKPKWIAINNNADGYDVLSIIGDGDDHSMSIEVKTTTQGLSGVLYLTRNEWEMAQDRFAHLFHLWDIQRSQPLLAKITVAQMAEHVPSNAGSGQWESVAIPFKAFSDSFGIVNTA